MRKNKSKVANFTELKRCNTSGNLYPATSEYFHVNNNTACGLRGDCKDCRNKRHREYYKDSKENQQRVAKAVLERREKIKSLPNDFTIKDWQNALNFFNNKCAYCNMTVEESYKKFNCQLVQDHVIPLSRRSGYTKDNIIPACKSCNSSKNDRDIIKWFEKRLFFKQENLDNILRFLGSVS